MDQEENLGKDQERRLQPPRQRPDPGGGEGPAHLPPPTQPQAPGCFAYNENQLFLRTLHTMKHYIFDTGSLNFFIFEKRSKIPTWMPCFHVKKVPDKKSTVSVEKF